MAREGLTNVCQSGWTERSASRYQDGQHRVLTGFSSTSFVVQLASLQQGILGCFGVAYHPHLWSQSLGQHPWKGNQLPPWTLLHLCLSPGFIWGNKFVQFITDVEEVIWDRCSRFVWTWWKMEGVFLDEVANDLSCSANVSGVEANIGLVGLHL